MGNYSEKGEKVKLLASFLFKIKDIALSIDMEVDAFRALIKKPGNEFFDAFHEGRLETQLKVNKSLIDLASNGSQPAINKVLEKQSLLDVESDDEE